MMAEIPAIGIDLGTTYSCVAVWQNGKVDIISNEQGNRTTPSYVAFTDTERLIGDAAKYQVAMNPTNTIFDVKRLIGRKFDDPKIQADMKHWPFTVINDGGKPKIQIMYKGESKVFEPAEISAMLLTKLRETADKYLGGKVKNAVITVPAYFNDAQRQTTKDAGTIAGLNVLRIINEPTAAALAYGLEKNLTGIKNVLIFDLGGGTFDVSILTINKGSVFEVKSTAGDTHLGGEDFDNRLVDYFAEEFKRKHKRDLTGNARALRRLRTACERAKRILSSSTEAAFEIDALCDGIDFSTRATRTRFEDLNMDLFRSTLQPLEQALTDAKMDKSSIDDIVLVGGSSRIPRIQKLVQDFFDRKDLKFSIHPDEAVAYGAAVQAAILTEDQSSKIQDVVLVDVIPISLGTDVHGNVMSVILKRNTPIPCKRVREYFTTSDNQIKVRIDVLEGERAITDDNHLLGTFKLTEITPLPKGEAKIDVTFDVNADGILLVTAEERNTGRSKQITITNNMGRLTEMEINQMISATEKFRVEDERQRQKVEARHRLEDFIVICQQSIDDDVKGNLSESEKQVIRDTCKSAESWLLLNITGEGKHFADQLREIQTKLRPILSKLENIHNLLVLVETADQVD